MKMRDLINIVEGKFKKIDNKEQTYHSESLCPECQGPLISEFEMLEGKKDACYYKVKNRVKVWPSAYASGQLVQCRKRGSGNWGKGSKK
jgi:hypothetical protein